MANIQMCANVSCIKRMTCARFRAVPEISEQEYIRPNAKNCQSFWHICNAKFPMREPQVAQAHHKRHYDKQKKEQLEKNNG